MNQFTYLLFWTLLLCASVLILRWLFVKWYNNWLRKYNWWYWYGKIYQKSHHWKRYRKLRIKKAKYRCEMCGDDAPPLQVHHLHYRSLGRESMKDTLVLCVKCHKKEHERNA